MSVSSQYHAYLPSATNYPSATMTTRHLDDPKTQSLKTAIRTAAAAATITLETPAPKSSSSPPPEEIKHVEEADVEMIVRSGVETDGDIKPSKEVAKAEPTHRRTDHEREEEEEEEQREAAVHAQTAFKDSGIDDMQTDPAQPKVMGPPPKPPLQSPSSSPPKGFTPYRLCRNAHAVLRPHPSQDLLSLYGLLPLAATVARKNPDGSKKPLRQSYSGKLEGVTGKTKVKVRNIENGPLTMLMRWPEEEWQNQKVRGREVGKGLSDALLGKLGLAMKMAPGAIPGFDMEMIAGAEATAELPPPPLTVPPPLLLARTPATPLTNGAAVAKSTPPTSLPPHISSLEAGRPKRNSKKRSYHERSFEGYAEGFLDDIEPPIEDTSGGLDYVDDASDARSGSGKKRKKNKDGFSPVAAPPLDDRGGSYGVGSLDVGIGAYSAR